MPRGVSAVDEARLQGRLWTPELMGNRQPLHWLEYGVDALSMSGSTITGLTPSRGRSRNNWAAKSGGTNPTLVTRNGFPAARFDGSQPMTHIATSVSGIANCTLMLAGYMISGGANEDIVFGFGSAFSGRWIYRAPSSGSMGFASWGNDIGSSGTSFDIAGIRPNVFAVRQTVSDVLFDRNGSIGQSTGTIPSVPTNVATAIISIGGISGTGGSNAYGTNIDVIAAMAWEFELTAVEYQKAQAYMCWRFGLPIVATSPYCNRPPLIGD